MFKKAKAGFKVAKAAKKGVGIVVRIISLLLILTILSITAVTGLIIFGFRDNGPMSKVADTVLDTAGIDLQIAGENDGKYELGELIVIKKIDAEKVQNKIKVGDVITYSSPLDYGVHTGEITEIDAENELISVKCGDSEDITSFSSVIGTPLFALPASVGLMLGN